MGHPQTRAARQTIVWLVTVLAGWLTCAALAPAQSRTPPDSALAAARHRNETLLGAAQPLLDIVRSAERRDIVGVDRSIATIRAETDQITLVLKPGAHREFETRIRDLDRARRQADLAAAAMAALEAYRTLLLSLDASALTIPVEVDELGYAGLKAELLTDGRTRRWADLVQVAADANQDWKLIRGNVHNDALRHVMQVALASLTQAARTRNAPMAYCAAHFTDAAADLLRQQFLLWKQ